jgi:hypothetical protein
MPRVSAFDVLSKTGTAVIDGAGFAVCVDRTYRSAMLVGETDEEQIEIQDQRCWFCEDSDGILVVEDTNGTTHRITCYRLVPLTLSDL